ncbi:centromere protein H [Aplochiton taeniatus]
MDENVAENGYEAADDFSKDSSPAEMLRIKKQMSNQCFEMQVKLQAENCKRSCSASEAERDLPDYVSELEQAKTTHFNKTLALHRMQVWHVIAEKLQQNDPEATAMKKETCRSLDLCSQIKELQKETKDLNDQIAEIQKQRLELKRLTHEKMKEIEELKKNKEHPELEKYRTVLQKGQSHLEKYQKMATMTQNVLRGIILASKVNWSDDPKLFEIAMALENSPIFED